MSQREDVAIVMATYNGEKYIRSQIESVLAQSYENIRLFIRDDGSTDSTSDIIKSYVNKDDRVTDITDGRRLGVPDTFYECLRQISGYRYYAFADQDDIWNREKIERAVVALDKYDDSEPLLYFADYDYVDDDGKIIRRSPDQTGRIKKNLCIYNSLSSGFMLVFNDALKQVATPMPGQGLHEYQDRRFIRVAELFGTVVYDDTVTASHIRHQQAVTSGNLSTGSMIKNFIHNELMGADAKIEKQGLEEFYNEFESRLSDSDRRLLEIFTGNGNYLRKLFYNHRLRRRLAGEVALRLLFLIGKI